MQKYNIKKPYGVGTTTPLGILKVS